MNFSWFANILVHHPIIILSAVAVFSGSCIIIPFTLKSTSFPNFQDPQMGFSTRGTTISNRLTTWENLVKSMRPSGEFTVNPKEYLYNRNKNNSSHKSKKNAKQKEVKRKPVYGSVSINEERNASDTLTEVVRWKAFQNLTPGLNIGNNRNTNNFFCGNPDQRYAHLVVTTYNKKDLFTISNMIAMCRLEHELMALKFYSDLCIQNTNLNKACCKPWSLPNYIAILNNRRSCLTITEEDVRNTKNILKRCAQYFHNLELNSDCTKTPNYCGAPIECVQHDAVYNIFNYLTTTSFLPPNNTEEGTELKETMIFLPLACSIAILPYYHELDKLNLEYGGIHVVAMDFGIKRALFEEYLIKDTWFMVSGTLFVFVCIWLYTQSIFLTIMTITVIVFSLAISHFMYILVFEIKFFPFMNLLGTIVAIGIGSDDAFIFCKIWQIQKKNQGRSLLKIMTDTFHHAFISMLVTALTTSVAFLGSYISSVTAVSCFSLFAGTAVVANYFLMMTWFPACLVIWERSCFSNDTFFKSCIMVCFQKWRINPQWNLSTAWFQCDLLKIIWKAKEEWLIDLVIRLKYFWLLLLISIAIISGFIVLIYPKVQLPVTHELQLFATSHPFEQYDFTYKNRFWFKNPERLEQASYKLPLRFVWGVLPVDNGDHLDPSDLGTLTLDPTFDMSSPESQEWLLNFCQNLRQQTFYQSMLGPLLPNCFVETFMKSMQRKCYDPFMNKDWTPCCETSKFPFNRSVFDECIIDEIADIYETPPDLLNPGMAGPKFSKDQNMSIKTIVIEYDSSYSYTMSYEHVHEFFAKVEGWMNEELQSAPDVMKNGWFISELEFYDLQRELNLSTETAIVMSMGLALIVLFLSTLNILTSLYAIITITCSIFVTVAVLIILGWKLNILESTAVSTAIGLTVDFSLHYSVNYRLCSENMAMDREAATRHALSYMAGPAFMGAVTTGAAGAFMLPSLVLPYIQIGIFLVLVMCVSWLYATFLLGSLLAIVGPEKNCGQFEYSRIVCCFGKPKRVLEISQTPPSNITDCIELESLTYRRRESSTTKSLRFLSSGRPRFIPSKYVFTDRSASATSASTIILADDN